MKNVLKQNDYRLYPGNSGGAAEWRNIAKIIYDSFMTNIF